MKQQEYNNGGPTTCAPELITLVNSSTLVLQCPRQIALH